MKFILYIIFILISFYSNFNLKADESKSSKQDFYVSTKINRLYDEGLLSKEHSKEFFQLKNKYLLTNNTIDLTKVKSTISFLKLRKEQLFNSIYLFEKDKAIKRHGLKDKKATKDSLSEIEDGESFLFLYDEAIDSLLKLDASSSMNEVNRIALFISVAEYFHQKHLLYEEINVLKSVADFFKKIKLNDADALEASNLIMDGKYLSKEKLNELKANNIDISDLSPADGPLWVNNSIEDYNPYNEAFYENGRIPKKGVDFHFKKMGGGQIKIKAFYLNKKGKKRSVDIKLGREVRAQLYAGQISRILGFTSLPTVYRKDIKMHLGETSYGEFAAAWDRAHIGAHEASASEFARSWFTRAGRYTYDKESHTVTLKEGYLEAYPNKGKYYFKGGTFKSSKHGFVNRREYRSLKLYSALINLVDNGDKNIRMDTLRESKDDTWTPLFYFNDIGTALGNWYGAFNTMSINEFGGKIAHKKSDGRVWLRYFSRHPDADSFDTATANDFKWLIKRMQRISPQQLLDIGLASGLPSFLAELYAERIKRRINNLIEVFELKNQTKLKITTYKKLNEKYPDLITTSGKLKAKADDFDNSVWYTGPSATLLEIIKNSASNLVHNGVSSLLNLELPILKGTTFFRQKSRALSLTGKRTVDQNNFYGPEQRRIQIHDNWTWSLPLGASQNRRLRDPINDNDFYLPIGLNLNYEISHYHSAVDLKEANLKNYENVVLPWKISNILKAIDVGESVRIIESANFNIGGLKGQITEKLRLQLDLLRFLKIKTKEIYIHRYSKTEVEIVVQNIDQYDLHSGVDIKAFIELTLSIGKNKIKTNYKYFRLNLEDSNESAVQKLYNRILTTRNLEAIEPDVVGAKASIVKSESQFYYGWKFFLWNFDRMSSKADYSIDGFESRVSVGDEPDKNKYQIFSHTLNRNLTKALSNTWDDGAVEDNDIDNRNLLNGLNLLLQFFDKQDYESVTAYAQTDDDVLKIKDLMVFIKVARSNNYISVDDFNNRYINYFSNIVGEKSEQYFNYTLPEGQKYFSPVRSELVFQISYKGIVKFINRAKPISKFCKKDIPCETKLGQIAKFIEFTDSILKSKHSIEKRKAKLSSALKAMTSLFEQLLGPKAYNLSVLRELIGDKHIWIVTRMSGVLPNAHPFARGKLIPLYASEIGGYQGKSPLKKVILKYQFFPKQNLFFDSLLPELDY